MKLDIHSISFVVIGPLWGKIEVRVMHMLASKEFQKNIG
jgi:hypothetical protein